jgi:hypothetical protein
MNQLVIESLPLSTFSHARTLMLRLGCTSPGRNTERHTFFAAIAETMKSLIPDIVEFRPEGRN